MYVRCRKSGDAASPLTSHVTIGWCTVVACQVRDGATSPHCSNSQQGRVQTLGRGDRSWAATKLSLNNCDNRARSRRRRQANNSSDIVAGQPPRYAHAGPGNCPLDEPPYPGKQRRRSKQGGYRQCQTNQVQWCLPPGGKRMPL